MSDTYGRAQVLMLTDRGGRHQRLAAEAAPREIALNMLRAPDTDDLRAALAQAEIVISERDQPVTAQMIAAAPKLRYILRLGSTIHRIDLAAARGAGIKLSVQPVHASIVAAEHVLMMILAVLKRLGRTLRAVVEPASLAPPRATDENTFAYNWMGFTDLHALLAKKVAILGMGEIGIELARRIAPFRPSVMWYHKRAPYAPEVEHALGIRGASFEQCVREADVLVNLLPFTTDTAKCFGEAQFDAMPPHAVLVHAGSGGVIDESALIHALARGRIAGAALDTFELEPLPTDHPLVALAREGRTDLLLTPHVASGSLAAARADDFAEVLRFLHGEPLRFEVSHEG